MTLKVTSKLEDWTFTAKVEEVRIGRHWIRAMERNTDGTINPITINIDNMNYNYEISED